VISIIRGEKKKHKQEKVSQAEIPGGGRKIPAPQGKTWRGFLGSDGAAGGYPGGSQGVQIKKCYLRLDRDTRGAMLRGGKLRKKTS